MPCKYNNINRLWNSSVRILRYRLLYTTTNVRQTFLRWITMLLYQLLWNHWILLSDLADRGTLRSGSPNHTVTEMMAVWQQYFANAPMNIKPWPKQRISDCLFYITQTTGEFILKLGVNHIQGDRIKSGKYWHTSEIQQIFQEHR